MVFVGSAGFGKAQGGVAEGYPAEGTASARTAQTTQEAVVTLGLSPVDSPPLLPQTLSHSLKMADQNLEKLKMESERLEQHAQKSVNWLLWAMLIIVCFVFISMILFIRIMPRLK